jgi:hypothetical protein
MSDEMTVPNHPHADQRNWQPGDTDDDELIDLEQYLALPRPLNRVLRTLKRMRGLTGIPPKILAAVISPHVGIEQIIWMKEYLEELAAAFGKQMEKRTCAGCGKPVCFKDEREFSVGETPEDSKIRATTTREYRVVRADAVYCSNACRQKAYRKRKTPRYGKKARGDRKAVTKVESVTEAPPDTATHP